MQQIPNRGHRQLRKGRHSIPGTYYSVTLSTIKREPILATPEIANIICDSFNWLETAERIKWICIMVMPDHVHAVFQLGNTHSLSSVIKSFKNYTAKQINIYLGRSGSLWQRAYHDHGIRKDESLDAFIRYCYENPVRRGLVTQARDYPYWKCKFEME